jgi:hypothetical protein
MRGRFVIVFVLAAVGQETAYAAPSARPLPSDAIQACATGYEEGQRLKENGELRRAREQLRVCATEPCPGPMISDCARWFTEVEGLMPSAVVRATDAAGREVTDVRVLFDGALLLERLNGRAADVDPGEHVFRFEPASGPPEERRVLIHEAEKGQRIEVRFGEAPPAAPVAEPARRGSGSPSPSHSPPIAAYVAGAVGVVALGSFALFGITGLHGREDLLPCRGACSDAAVDKVQRDFLAADISLGISVVAFGVATILWLAHREAETPAAAPTSSARR